MQEKHADKIFTLSGLRKEFRRIRWPHWFHGEKLTEESIVPTTIKVLSFTVSFALFFVLCDFILAKVLSI